MRALSLLGLALGAALATACGPTAAGRAAAPEPAAHASRAALDRFLADEERVLALVASADARIAARGVAPGAGTIRRTAMTALLAEDKTIALEPGPGGVDQADVFSLDARARTLDEAQKILATWRTPPNNPDAASTLAPGLELELLGRFVASEQLRLADERTLPRSASTLLGAIAATWRPPSDAEQAAARDEWLAKRLAQVTESLGPKSLTGLERDELEDSLDPLERVVGDALPRSRQGLVALRLALQRVDPAAKPPDRWAEISARLAADAGVHLSPETLLALLSAEAKLLRADADELVGASVTDDMATRAAQSLLAPPAECRSSAPPRMRALRPPPERSLDCALQERVVAARTASENLEVVVAMHEAVVTAAHALVFARGGDDVAVALAAPKPLASLQPTEEGRLDRFAAVHPVEAISRALSIEWLMRNGLGQAALRARAARAFGDAPLDVLDREIHPQPRAEDRLRRTHSS